MNAEDVRKLVRAELQALLGEDQVLDAEGAAEFLGISKNALYEFAGRGDIPCRRLGRRLIFSKSSLIDWLRG